VCVSLCVGVCVCVCALVLKLLALAGVVRDMICYARAKKFFHNIHLLTWKLGGPETRGREAGAC